MSKMGEGARLPSSQGLGQTLQSANDTGTPAASSTACVCSGSSVGLRRMARTCLRRFMVSRKRAVRLQRSSPRPRQGEVFKICSMCTAIIGPVRFRRDKSVASAQKRGQASWLYGMYKYRSYIHKVRSHYPHSSGTNGVTRSYTSAFRPPCGLDDRPMSRPMNDGPPLRRPSSSPASL